MTKKIRPPKDLPLDVTRAEEIDPNEPKSVDEWAIAQVLKTGRPIIMDTVEGETTAREM